LQYAKTYCKQSKTEGIEGKKHTASAQKLEAQKAWERGYVNKHIKDNQNKS